MVQPVLLSPLVYQLTVFGQVSVLTILHYLFTMYRAIEEINFKENMVKMMEPYDPADPLAQLIKYLEKGR